MLKETKMRDHSRFITTQSARDRKDTALKPSCGKSALGNTIYGAHKWNQLTWCLIQSFQQAADVGAYAPWRPQQ